MKLLSIDWDYFFPIPASDPRGLFDWGHREASFFIEDIWPFRAASFVRSGMALPGLSGDERTFWKGIKTTKDAPLFIAESHAFAVDPRITASFLEAEARNEKMEIWSYDAHHDLGYSDHAITDILNGTVDCGNWLLAYLLRFRVDIKIRYPRWHKHALDQDEIKESLSDLITRHHVDLSITKRERRPVFDAIFICRSGAWTPPWLDRDFQTFTNGAPNMHQNNLHFIDGSYHFHLRDFSMKDVYQLAETEQRELDAYAVKT